MFEIFAAIVVGAIGLTFVYVVWLSRKADHSKGELNG